MWFLPVGCLARSKPEIVTITQRQGDENIYLGPTWAHVLFGNAKLHGTERFQRPNVSAQGRNMDPCRATVARVVATQERPRILP